MNKIIDKLMNYFEEKKTLSKKFPFLLMLLF